MLTSRLPALTKLPLLHACELIAECTRVREADLHQDLLLCGIIAISWSICQLAQSTAVRSFPAKCAGCVPES